ncbi:MAG: hypothetical protein HC857_14555 [Synechococcales cyanobacterium RU_4_20]|nr:hypothetical protein [Synechococcales cyanobacterium RU_4_20]NJR68170.1 hypothetical protein [Synechococcales cyanobacterium CRU_2_2]
MAQLAPIQLEDGTTIYIEASDEWAAAAPVPVSSNAISSAPSDAAPEMGRDQAGAAKGWSGGHQSRAALPQGLDAMENTIRAYTQYTLNAFKHSEQASPTGAKISKVMLEFGVKLSGEAGIPYITKGSAEGNLKVSVECLFA